MSDSVQHFAASKIPRTQNVFNINLLNGWLARWMNRLMNEYPFIHHFLSLDSIFCLCVCVCFQSFIEAIFRLHSYFNLTGLLTALITQMLKTACPALASVAQSVGASSSTTPVRLDSL